MATEGIEVLILLPSIHHVMKAEARLLEEKIPCDLVPVPREIASDCGMAVTVAEEDRRRALKHLAEEALPVSRCYRKIGRSYEPLNPSGEEVAP